jgi:predicted TIM-barrel fold metal-dependent hydrolase
MLFVFRPFAFLIILSMWACQGSPTPTKVSNQNNPSLKKKVAALEAEVAQLRAAADTAGVTLRANPWPIVNAHEHMFKERHLVNYLAAARVMGIAKTILVASPEFTIYGKGDQGWEMMQSNFEDILAVTQASNGELIPFMTVDPLDEDRVARMKRNYAAGAKGIKIYTGHSNFHKQPLDDPSMDPVFAYLEETGMPINWHINLTKFSAEFSRVMDKYPKLNVMVPHYGVAFWRAEKAFPKMAELMRKYPNMYVDTSLGTREILIDGLVRLGEPGHHEAFVAFIDEFQDRIVFGTDAVITGNREKTVSWYRHVMAATRDQLEKASFNFPLAEGYSRYFKKKRDATGRLRGVALAPEVLQKIYVDNAERWLAGR